jgi:hypothetical protein
VEPFATQSLNMQQEPFDIPRLLARVQHYAAAAGASPSSISNMLDMLQSPLGLAIVLELAHGPALTSQLNNDLYKVAMQSMYAQFMTGERLGISATWVEVAVHSCWLCCFVRSSPDLDQCQLGGTVPTTTTPLVLYACLCRCHCRLCPQHTALPPLHHDAWW